MNISSKRVIVNPNMVCDNKTLMFCFKVVGEAQATKSNSHNFWYRCLVLVLIDVSKVLAQTLHDCMTYERKEKPKIRVKFQVQLIN